MFGPPPRSPLFPSTTPSRPPRLRAGAPDPRPATPPASVTDSARGGSVQAPSPATPPETHAPPLAGTQGTPQHPAEQRAPVRTVVVPPPPPPRATPESGARRAAAVAANSVPAAAPRATWRS